MTFPAILFGFVLSSAYGAAFHFWKGGSLNKLVLFVLLAWLGFWAGHFAGTALDWSFASVGPLNTGMGTLGAAVFLLVGEWLSRVQVVQK
jgi:hypothetical protein